MVCAAVGRLWEIWIGTVQCCYITLCILHKTTQEPLHTGFPQWCGPYKTTQFLLPSSAKTLSGLYLSFGKVELLQKPSGELWTSRAADWRSSSSSAPINSRAGQIFTPVDATNPAVRYRSSAKPHSLVARSAPWGHVSWCLSAYFGQDWRTWSGVWSACQTGDHSRLSLEEWQHWLEHRYWRAMCGLMVSTSAFLACHQC